MRHSLSLALLVLASPCFAADAKPVSLFDGKTLTGWEGDEKTWKVEDGAIVGGSLTDTVPRNEFLWARSEKCSAGIRQV
jgi:3-keto-disaccharide hydrolase